MIGRIASMYYSTQLRKHTLVCLGSTWYTCISLSEDPLARERSCWGNDHVIWVEEIWWVTLLKKNLQNLLKGQQNGSVNKGASSSSLVFQWNSTPRTCIEVRGDPTKSSSDLHGMPQFPAPTIRTMHMHNSNNNELAFKFFKTCLQVWYVLNSIYSE